MGVHHCVLHDSVEKSESRQRPPATRQAHIGRMGSSFSDKSWATASHHVLTSVLQLMVISGHCSRAMFPTMWSPDSVGEKLCWAAAALWGQRLKVIATKRPWPPSAYPEHPVHSRCLLSGTIENHGVE